MHLYFAGFSLPKDLHMVLPVRALIFIFFGLALESSYSFILLLLIQCHMSINLILIINKEPNFFKNTSVSAALTKCICNILALDITYQEKEVFMSVLFSFRYLYDFECTTISILIST